MNRALTLPWLIEGHEQYGVRSASRALICALRDLDVSCPIVALSEGEFAVECADLGFHVVGLGREQARPYEGGVARKALQFLWRRRQDAGARRTLITALRSIRADALNFCPPTLVGIAGPAAHANGIRTFWHVPNVISSGYPLQINRRIYQRWCSRFGIVPLANSEYTATSLGDAPVRPEVLYLSVDADRFDPARVVPVSRASLGIDEASVVIGVVARLHPSKGQGVVLEAVLRLVAEGHDIHLVVVGGPTRGEYYERMRSMIQQSGRPSRFHFVGAVADTERFYPLLDLSVSSTVVAEPFGISVIESMMSGRPVLAHALGGPAETVVDGVTGWHYHDPNVDTVSVALRRAIRERDRWPVMGAAARAYALTNFSLEVQARNYLRIVDKVLNADRRRPSP